MLCSHYVCPVITMSRALLSQGGQVHYRHAAVTVLSCLVCVTSWLFIKTLLKLSVTVVWCFQRNVRWWEFPTYQQICLVLGASCSSTLLIRCRTVFTSLTDTSRVSRNLYSNWHRSSFFPTFVHRHILGFPCILNSSTSDWQRWMSKNHRPQWPTWVMSSKKEEAWHNKTATWLCYCS